MVKLSNSAQGVLYATAAYVWWGFLPLFWAIFDPVGNGWEVIAHRIFWTGVLLAVWIAFVLAFTRFVTFVKAIWQSRRQTVLLLCAAVVSALNFWVNVAGVITGHVVELGIGTFLTPLLTIALGIVFFHERPPLLTWIAIASALAGVAVMIVQVGRFPFYALMVSSTWAAYGALKKALMVDAVLSLAVETFLMMPLAVGYVAYLTVMGSSHFSPTADPGLAAAFVATGVMAAVPLVAFTIGAMRLSLSVLGFIQYLAPILIVALGVFVFGEPFGAREILPLSFIWLGIAVFLAGQVREHKNSSQLHARS